MFRNIKLINKLFVLKKFDEIISHNHSCLLNESVILERWVKMYYLSTEGDWIIPKTKKGAKIKYRSINLTEDLVLKINKIIPGFYRSHYEAIFEWVRGGMFDLAKKILEIEKCKKLKKKINKSADTIA